MKPRNSADITCESRSASELSWIASLGDYSGGGKCAHARNCCEQLSNLIRVESQLDVGLEFADSCTEGDYILAGVTHLELIRLARKVTYRNLSCLNQGAG